MAPELRWRCAPADPGGAPSEDAWLPAAVPGTAAGALRDAGLPIEGRDLDAEDWWFRSAFDAEPGAWTLELGGLATLAEVRLNDEVVHRSESMFLPARVPVELAERNVLELRFRALGPVLATKHPRGRWRTSIVSSQHLRWYRTTFLGRMPGWSPGPAPVGPWRPVRLTRSAPVRLRAACEGTDGVVHVEAEGAEVAIGGVTAPLAEGRASVHIPQVQRWWPHTHGEPHRYEVRLDGEPAGHVGFRTVEADGVALRINGAPVFCRGAVWTPPDPVSLNAPAAEVRRTLEQVRAAGMNMVRLAGPFVYEDETFWDLCDELGVLVWQDAMFANLDPPDDEAFLATVEAELATALGAAAAHPALAVVCGGSEVEQQAAMLGLPPERRTLPLFETHLPRLLDRLGIDVPYVPNSPTGGELPFRVGTGVAHYYGVGAYRRPVADARTSGVRFASECLAFATPPAGEVAPGEGVPHDNGATWDFEDVRDHYVGTLFDVDPRLLRATDPARYLDLGRAAVAEVVTAVLTEWRRPGSPCAGALVLMLRDLRPGSGWGLLDAGGTPKAPWWALRRVLAPAALLATDEGLDGLHLHLLNDTPEAVAGPLEVELHDPAGRVLESASLELEVGPRRATTISAEAVLGGFRDVTWAYRFGPQAYDAVVARWCGREVVFLPGGPARPRQADIGLRAERRGDELVVSTDALAQYVHLAAPGIEPDDAWFHLPAGASRTLRLRGDGGGEVRALNAAATARFA